MLNLHLYASTFGLDIELCGIDYVLPSDVGCRPYRCHGMEEGQCHPYRQHGVFLSQSLRSGYTVAASPSDNPAYDELRTADYQREERHYNHFPRMFMVLNHVTYCVTNNNDE